MNKTATDTYVRDPAAVRELQLKPRESSGRQALVVLGMHRSGTSVLSRILSLLGCDLPATLIPASENNEAGYWESRKLTDLNDRILASAGSSWDDWTKFNPKWIKSPKAIEFRENALQILEQEFDDSLFFVVKDPRICRFPEFWLETLQKFGANPFVFIQIRNPLEVASSLFARNGIPTEVSHLLWLRHILDAEAGTRDFPRVFSTFDGLLRKPACFMEEAGSKLDVHWPRLTERTCTEIDEFIDDDLRHHREDAAFVINSGRVPQWLRDAVEVLYKWSAEGEQSRDRAILDAIRGEFDSGTPGFHRAITAGWSASMSARKQADALKELQEELRQNDEELRQKDEELRQKDEELRQKDEELRQKDEELRGLRTKLADEKSKKGSLEGEFAATRTELLEVRQALSEREQRLNLLEVAYESEAASLRRSEATLKSVQSERAKLRGELSSVREQAKSSDAALRSQVKQVLGDAKRAAAKMEEERRDMANRLKDDAKRAAAKMEEERRDMANRLKDMANRLEERRDMTNRLKEAASLELGRAIHSLLMGRKIPLLERFLRKRRASRLRRSGVFDAGWYLETYRDVAKAGVDPALHYLADGWKEGREPNSSLAETGASCARSARSQ